MWGDVQDKSFNELKNVSRVKKFNADNDVIDCDDGETLEPSINLRPRNDLKKPGRYDDFVQCVF